MVKHYLSKWCLLLCLICSIGYASRAQAAADMSELFVNVTEATLAVQQGEQTQAQAWVDQIEQSFKALTPTDTEAGQAVKAALNMPTPITEADLVKLSSALLAYEKEQNPVDLVAGKKRLEKRLMPTLKTINTAITSQAIEQVKEAYKQFNTAWTANEKVIRDTDSTYYGKIETEVALLRSAIEVEPSDFERITQSYQRLNTALQDYLAGKEIEAVATTETLSDGIRLLEDSHAAFQAGDTAKGSQIMQQFIELWPRIEGDISTRNPELYNQVENETPIIMVKGSDPQQQQTLATLITSLKAINPTASYHFVDAMSILLREGLEAMIIVLALVSSLKAMKQKQGMKWVYGGVWVGLVASLLLAVALAYLIPIVSSGTAREQIEGYIGLFAVLMLVIVGIWLHRRSSLASWQAYLQQQLNKFESSGRYITLFGLSFLAVFREGAEMMLFFVGILPKISWFDLILGIGLALIILVAIWLVLSHMTRYVVAYRLFALLGWLIYALAFKMLGVSVHTLQLTGVLPTHLLSGVPTWDWIGLYPSVESLLAQGILIGIIAWLLYGNRRKKSTGVGQK